MPLRPFTAKNKQPNNLKRLSYKGDGVKPDRKVGLKFYSVIFNLFKLQTVFVFTRSPLLSCPFLQSLAEQGRHRPAKPHTLTLQFFHCLLYEESSLFPLNILLPFNSN